MGEIRNLLSESSEAEANQQPTATRLVGLTANWWRFSDDPRWVLTEKQQAGLAAAGVWVSRGRNPAGEPATGGRAFVLSLCHLH